MRLKGRRLILPGLWAAGACMAFCTASLSAREGNEPAPGMHALLTGAYEDMRDEKYERAEQRVKEALVVRPDHYELNMLMAQLLERRGDWAGVESRLSRALDTQPGKSFALASRGFARQHLKKKAEARHDFEAALNSDDLTGEVERNVRAALAPAAPQDSAAKSTAPSTAISGDFALQRAYSALSRKDYDGVLTALRSGGRRGLAAERRGEYLYLEGEGLWGKGDYSAASRKYEEAETFLRPPFYRSEALWKRSRFQLQEGNSLAALKLGRESAALLPENSVRNMDMAYLCLAHGRDREATLYFEKGLSSLEEGGGGTAVRLDAAYAHKRLGENESLLRYLTAYIDRESLNAHPAPEDAARLYYARREYADVNRSLGLRTSFQYLRTEEDSFWQGIGEVYWRPYYENGREVELFAQFGGVPWAKRPGLVGHTNFASAGVRVSPFASQNLVFTAEQMFKLGRAMRNDPRIRAGYSWDDGLEWNPVRDQWRYISVFAELTYSIGYDEVFFTGEGRYGRSFKLGSRLVASPHVFLYFDSYSEALERKDKWRNFAGPGVHFRQWYREDKYNAPRSYFDCVMQYRIHWGDSRYNALVLTLFNSF